MESTLYDSRMYLRNAQGTWVTAQLPMNLRDSRGNFATDSGRSIECSDADEINYLYVQSDDEICAVAMDGTVTTVTNNVYRFSVNNGVLCCSHLSLDDEKALYAATLNGVELGEEHLVTDRAYQWGVTESGQYIYVRTTTADDEKNQNSLYVYPVSGGDGVLLSAGMHQDSMTALIGGTNVIAYIDDGTYQSDVYEYIGVLRVYDPDTGEAEEVDTDIAGSFHNGKVLTYLDGYEMVRIRGDLLYWKHMPTEDNIYNADVYAYDGENRKLIMSGLNI